MPSESTIWCNGRFVTQALTGVQRYSYNLAQRMPDLRLISPRPPSKDYAELDPSRIHVRPSRLPTHAWDQFVLPRGLGRGSLLWSPGGVGPVSAPSHVWTIHDLAPYDHPESYSKAYLASYGAVTPFVVRNARKIITVSEFTKTRIMQRLKVPEDKIVVVLEAPDVGFVPIPESDIRSYLASQNIVRPYVLALGAVSPRKNFGRLLKAWEQVGARFPDFDLIVVGRINLAFSSDSSLGPLPRNTVHLTGVSDEMLHYLMAGASVFAFPSLYEGFGLPVLEAMAVGAPVLSSNSSSIPEVAGDAALLVSPTNIGEIADGLSELLSNNTLRAAMREKGLRRASQFSWDRAAAETWAALRTAAEG